MELEKIAKKVAKYYNILLEKREGSMIGTNMSESIIYSSTLFPKDDLTYDILIVNKDTKLTLTHIYGKKEKRELQFLVPSLNAYQYLFSFKRCYEPYNKVADLIEKENKELKRGSYHAVRMELKNFDKAYEMIIKVL